MHYDIAVIGAGPAGATFARRLLQKSPETRLLLLDGQSERRKKPCGGLLAPDAQKALAHFDLTLPKSALVDPQIFAVQTIDLVTRRVRYYQRYYLNMNRYAFDRWLLSLVPEEADILPGHCTALCRIKDGFSLTVQTAAGEQHVTARRVVGADGASSIVRRSLYDDSMMRYVSIQQWFTRTEDTAPTPFYSCIFDPKTSESCSWTIHKDEFIIFGGCFAPQGCREAFEEQKQRLEAYLGHPLGTPLKTEACQAARPRSMHDFITGKDGAYLIGEAAGFISASSFEGISSAIRSGTMLADAMLTGGEEAAVAARYRRSTRMLRLKLFGKMLKRWFMYTPWVRRLIMASGLDSIAVDVSSPR